MRNDEHPTHHQNKKTDHCSRSVVDSVAFTKHVVNIVLECGGILGHNKMRGRQSRHLSLVKLCQEILSHSPRSIEWPRIRYAARFRGFRMGFDSSSDSSADASSLAC